MCLPKEPQAGANLCPSAGPGLSPLPFLLAIALIGGAAGCSDGPGASAEPPGLLIRDSAGIEIVDNPGDEDAPVLSFETELSIGVADGDTAFEFSGIGPVAVAPDGTIFVANGGSGSIRVFTAGGEFVRELGRGGEGPGEFVTIDGLWFEGDRAFAFDGRLRRLTAFEPEGGQLASTWDLRSSEGLLMDIAMITGEGAYAWVRTPTRRFEESLERYSVFRDTVELRVFDLEANELGPPRRVEGTERRQAAAEVYPSGPLFEPVPLHAIAPDGRQFGSRDAQFAIDVYAPGGRLVRRIRRAIPRVPITQAHVAAIVERGGRGERGSAVRRAAAAPPPPAFAQIASILAGTDGSLLVLRMDMTDPLESEWRAGFRGSSRAERTIMATETRWDLIAADGRYAGTVTMPRQFTPRWFDGTRVVGVQVDLDLGFESVRRVRIR